MSDLHAALRRQVSEATGSAEHEWAVHPLPKNASNRRYYRLANAQGSWVVMVMPPEAKASEELSTAAPPPELPFLNVHRYLEQLRVRVPRIARYDEPAGMMVLEDLGDATFEKALEEGKRNAEFYPRAVDLLARLRAEAERAPDPRCIAFSRAFDATLYEWEFHHFREWGLEVWSGKRPTASERVELDRIFRRAAEQLAAEPTGFTHRDYQSRNLMVKDGELVVIDFQDALLGPRQYDLVALLRDSYVELAWPFVDAMLDLYLARFERYGGQRIDPATFKATFDLLTIQRKLKDAGRFEFIHRMKGDPNFLPSIPASLRYVKSAFGRYRDLAPLQALVSPYVPELA